MLEKQKANVKETWKIQKELNNKRKTYPEYFLKNTKRITQKDYIANEFNKFFTNVGPNLVKISPYLQMMQLFMIT